MLKNKKIYRYPISLFIVLGTLLCIFPPDHLYFKWFAIKAPLIMLSFLLAGMFFLITKERNLMYVSLLSCGALCFFLRGTDGVEDLFRFVKPEPNLETKISVAHFNLSNLEQEYDLAIQAIIDTDADIVSIQELTPDWNWAFKNALTEAYPYSKNVVRIDFFGLALYSKYPITQADTFHYKDIPNIIGRIKVDDEHKEVLFVSSHMTPPVSSSSYKDIRLHLNQVAQNLNSFNAPMIVLGDYNVVPWSSEIQSFRSKTKLNHAQRDFMASLPNPIDYIFFSKEFNCLSFSNINGANENSIGIFGEYQFKYSSGYAQ